jgi:hypothetical protein
VACAAVASVPPSAGRAVACRALPTAQRGVYRRVPHDDWRLTLGACRFGARKGTVDEGGGAYSVLGRGELVLSGDRGCPETGAVRYRFAFAGLLLRLAPRAEDPCAGRGDDLSGHPWVKLFRGRETIVYDLSSRRGKFRAAGAVSDAGKAAVSGGRLSLVGSRGTIVLALKFVGGRPRTWRVASATGSYVQMTGGGTASARVIGSLVHATLTGTLAN